MESRTLQLLEYPKVLRFLARSAVSEPGREACARVAPLESLDGVEREARLFRQARDWLGRTRYSLSSFPDLGGLLSFLESRKAPLDQDGLFALRETLSVAKAARSAILEHKDGPGDQELPWPDLAELASARGWPAKAWSALNRCLAPDGNLKDESSPELMSARMEIRHIHQQCTRGVKEFIAEHNLSQYLQDEFMTISSDRYVLPLKTNFKGRLQGIIHDYSQTGETCYFEPMFLVERNNTLRELKQEEREAERRVLAMLSGLAREELPGLAGAFDFLVALDVLMAKAAFADAFQAHSLDFSREKGLSLLQARHPVLVDEAGKQGTTVPLDLELNPGQRCLLISGGNAGGKTVCLKTLGLITLMAMAGLPVPSAEGSSLPPWKKVFVFMGDEQSLEDQVSTFTAQIRHLARVWDQVDEHTLVLLDEFGAGTDPSQGAALALAVIDKLLEKGAYVAAATHFPALKAHAMAKAEIRAASVLFDPASKKPLYRLGFDQVGASQALAVAREHGLPEEVLAQAEKNLLLDGSDTSGLIERLNERVVARDRELADLAQKQAKFEEKRVRLDERFEREKTALLKEIRAQAQDVLRLYKAGKLKHKQALRELSQAREKLRVREVEQERKTNFTFEDLAKGQTVLYLPWGKQGVIESTDDKRRQVKLDLSGVSMWAAPEDLDQVNGARPSRAQASYTARVESRSSLLLDLRGRRADAAREELEKFLDRALLGNMSAVEIIHGKGTGALRKEVHDFLSTCPAVADFSLGNEEEGGDGKTVVELK